MATSDLRMRAAWLRAVSARLAKADVAELLCEFADEMSRKADVLDAYRGRPARSGRMIGHV